MATRKCGNIYFPKYFMAVRPFFTRIFFQELFGLEGSNNFLEISSGAQSEDLEPSFRAVLMGTKSCTKILNFSTRFSCENLAVEDFVTLLMGKKSC